LRKERSRIAAGLNPRARKLFDQAADTRLNSAQQTAFQHVGAEKRTWQDEVDTNSIAVALSDAGNAFDNPERAEIFIKTAMAGVDKMAGRNGWSAERLLAEKLKFTSGARKDIAMRLGNRSADVAENYLKVYRDQFTSDDAAAVENDIRVERNRAAAELRRQQAEQRQAQREERAIRGEQARDLIGMMEQGDLDVPEASVEQLASRIEADGNPVHPTLAPASERAARGNPSVYRGRRGLYRSAASRPPPQSRGSMLRDRRCSASSCLPKIGATHVAERGRAGGPAGRNKLLLELLEGRRNDCARDVAFIAFAGASRGRTIDRPAAQLVIMRLLQRRFGMGVLTLDLIQGSAGGHASPASRMVYILPLASRMMAWYSS
jgi:hypothetical protein